MTDAIFPIPGYPTLYHTPGGTPVTIRPMLPTDKDALLDFFRRISPEDRLYLKDDVTSPEVIAHWAETLDYRRVLPLLALVGDTVIGDGTLHYSRTPALRHVGEVRVVIDPAYRGQGLGRFVLHHLVNIAKNEDSALEKILFEVVADTERAAQHAAQTLGFVPVAVFAKHVRYYGGEPHDLLVMELRVEAIQEDNALTDPATYMF
jgi:RimJ/RimL family protein N-acetyltransferase